MHRVAAARISYSPARLLLDGFLIFAGAMFARPFGRRLGKAGESLNFGETLVRTVLSPPGNGEFLPAS